MLKTIEKWALLGYASVTNMDWPTLRAIKYASFWTFHLFWFSIYPVLHKSSLIVNNTISITLKFMPTGIEPIKIEMPFTMLALYIGSLCIVLANVIYHVRCPSIIKRYEDYSEFLRTGMSLGYLEHVASKDLPPQSDAVKSLRNLDADELESSKESKFANVYLGCISLYENSRYISGILFAVGFLSVAFIASQNIFYVFFG